MVVVISDQRSTVLSRSSIPGIKNLYINPAIMRAGMLVMCDGPARRPGLITMVLAGYEAAEALPTAGEP